MEHRSAELYRYQEQLDNYAALKRKSGYREIRWHEYKYEKPRNGERVLISDGVNWSEGISINGEFDTDMDIMFWARVVIVDRAEHEAETKRENDKIARANEEYLNDPYWQSWRKSTDLVAREQWHLYGGCL